MTLSAADLASVRATQTNHLPDKGTVQRLSVVDDGIGGQTETWTTVTTGVRVRIGAVVASRATIISDRISTAESLVATLPWGTDVKRRDRIIVSGRTYTVLDVTGDESWSTAVRADVQEVE